MCPAISLSQTPSHPLYRQFQLAGVGVPDRTEDRRAREAERREERDNTQRGGAASLNQNHADMIGMIKKKEARKREGNMPCPHRYCTHPASS
jgi:hypothetical protein